MIICIAAALILLVIALFIEPHRLVVKKHVIPVDVTQTVRIIHISDTHYRKHFSRNDLLRLIVKVNQYEPDFIVFTGDFMDHYETAKQLRYQLPPYFQALHAKKAKLAVYGNHDIGGGAKSVYEEMMKESGFYVLRNKRIVFDELQLAFFGIDDALAGYEDRTITEARLQPVQILLAHEPDLVDLLNMKEISIMLSGHTHGGQVRLPLLTKLRLPRGGKHYPRGIYRIQNTILSVSSGIGTTQLPLRFACPPEIILYELKPSRKN